MIRVDANVTATDFVHDIYLDYRQAQARQAGMRRAGGKTIG